MSDLNTSPAASTSSSSSSTDGMIATASKTTVNVHKPPVFIETYGCQMNVLDSELVVGQLRDHGYRITQEVDEAGVVLLNTCSVRDLAEQKVWSRLGRLAIHKERRNPNLVVGVLGCMAEREGTNILKRSPVVEILCGPSSLDQLPQLLDNALHNFTVPSASSANTSASTGDTVSGTPTTQVMRGKKGGSFRRSVVSEDGSNPRVALAGHNSRRSKTLEAAMSGIETLDLSRAFTPNSHKSATQAYVRITQGCNKFCSFCVVPFTRGPETHRPPENIVGEVQRLVDNGVVEVTLLGQTVNHYAYQNGGHTTSFADLLWRVHEEVPGLQRLRFITSYPRDFSDAALDAMANADRICKYLHIPAQSGSNSMLKAMNRGYTVEQYFELLERARSRMPNIRLAGDMIVGFPNETEADHEASMALLRQAQYKSCFVFKYSPRPGTVSDKRLADNIPESLKKIRNHDLLNLQAEISLKKNQEYIGKTVPVLVEDFGRKHGGINKPAANAVFNVHLGWEKNRANASGENVRLLGRTEGDEIVAFDGDPALLGTLVSVEVKEVTNVTLMGHLGA